MHGLQYHRSEEGIATLWNEERVILRPFTVSMLLRHRVASSGVLGHCEQVGHSTDDISGSFWPTRVDRLYVTVGGCEA